MAPKGSKSTKKDNQKKGNGNISKGLPAVDRPKCQVCRKPKAKRSLGAIVCKVCCTFYSKNHDKSPLRKAKDCEDRCVSQKFKFSCEACRMKKCKKAGMRKKGEPVPQPKVKPARAKVEDWCTLEPKIGSRNVFDVEEVFVGSTRSQKQGTKKIKDFKEEVKSRKEEEIGDEVELEIQKDDDEEMPDDLQPQDVDEMSVAEDVPLKEVEEEGMISETPPRDFKNGIKGEEKVRDELDMDIRKERDEDEEMPDDLQPQNVGEMSVAEDVFIKQVEEEEMNLETPPRAQDAEKMSIDEDVAIRAVKKEEINLETPPREHCVKEEETGHDYSEREPRRFGNTDEVEHRRTGQVVVHSPQSHASSSSKDTEAEGKETKKEETSEIRKRINTWCLDHETSEDAWLDDNVIRVYLELLCSDRKKYEVIDPILWSMYKKYGILSIEKHLSSSETCFFPICEKKHWILLIFDKTHIWYADSVSNEPKEEVEKLMKLMNRTRLTFDKRNPKQIDDFNCGVHVCLVAKSIVTRQFWYEEAEVLGFRKAMKEMLKRENYELFSEAPQKRFPPKRQEKPDIDDDEIIVTYLQHPTSKSRRMVQKFPAVHRREEQRKVLERNSMFSIERNETSRFNKRNWGNERSSTNRHFVKPVDYQSMSPKFVANLHREQKSRSDDWVEIEVFNTPSYKIDSAARTSRCMEFISKESLQEKNEGLDSENQTSDVYSNIEVISIKAPEVQTIEEVPGELIPSTSSESEISKTKNNRYSEKKGLNFELDLSRMGKYIHKMKFKVFLIMANNERIDLTAPVSGEFSSHSRRQALCLIFKKWLPEATDLFNTTSESAVAYDEAEFIYARHYIMKLDKIVETTWKLNEDNFTSEELSIVNEISRCRGSEYEITVASVGRVITYGPEALSEDNLSELEKCIQCISNKALRSDEYYFHADGIYPVWNGIIVSEPDATTEIKLGFSKVCSVTTANNGIEARMALEIRRSCFIKEMPLLDFVCAKYLELQYEEEGRHFCGLQKHHLKKFKKICKRKRLDKKLLAIVSAALEGLEVRETHSDGEYGTIILDGMGKYSPKESEFPVEAGEAFRGISVVRFFEWRYGTELKYPRLPVVETKDTNSHRLYPIEFLSIVPGQRVKPEKMTRKIQQHLTDAENASNWDYAEQVQILDRQKIYQYLKYSNSFFVTVVLNNP
ncbi:hypothetical protein B9Z55_027861 [Caenorhabditis nigoni]|uniref:Ubiquitin-like protease family profile domain-containing protein n=1 Tax=Caenorhabditis nigoni TaxID=1611254 RepID=A0A2G5SDR1_9PELO|nr:hypothetical protein B9Z55_027861 [Caenorhabditis nigoni]